MRRLEADGSQAAQLCDQPGESAMPRRAGRLPGPDQRAHRSTLLCLQQSLECFRLGYGQSFGELGGHLALGEQYGCGNNAFDDGWTGRDDLTLPHLVHQRRGDRRRTGGGECHRQQPCQQITPLHPFHRDKTKLYDAVHRAVRSEF